MEVLVINGSSIRCSQDRGDGPEEEESGCNAEVEMKAEELEASFVYILLLTVFYCIYFLSLSRQFYAVKL